MKLLLGRFFRSFGEFPGAEQFLLITSTICCPDESQADGQRLTIKAALFGLIAGMVACYRGLTISGGGAKAVGNAVNETVVYAFMGLFVVNVVVTAIGIQLTSR